MRTYGRTADAYGNLTWVQVSTDSAGFNDYVYITTLIQVLKLSIGESPFWSNYGIPAQQSVIQQIIPDFYITQIQQQFSQYFASLSVARISDNPPTYNINVIMNNGTKFQTTIAS